MCVHTSHCCVFHGCKYGDADCPVVNGHAEQEFLCEMCDEMGIGFDDIHKPELSPDHHKIIENQIKVLDNILTAKRKILNRQMTK